MNQIFQTTSRQQSGEGMLMIALLFMNTVMKSFKSF